MARARNIKPGFFKNEYLAECSAWTRLCFAGLWTLADREGRLEDRPKRIKGELFAFDSVEVDPLLVELSRYGFIERYEVDGQGFIQINAFLKHQNPHHKEPPSVIPSPKSPGFYPHANNTETEAAHPLHDTKTLDKSEASPGFSIDERAKHGVKTVLNPDSGFLNPDSPSLIPEEIPPANAGLSFSPAATNDSPVEAEPKKPSVPDCPHGKLLALWAEVLPAMPQHNPDMWRGTRADHLRARWRETAAAKKWPDQDTGLAYFRKLFGFVGKSAFLTGQTRSADPNKRPFTVELEWLVNPTNWAKVHEGKYHAEG